MPNLPELLAAATPGCLSLCNADPDGCIALVDLEGDTVAVFTKEADAKLCAHRQDHFEPLIEALEMIASPVIVDGENHMADVRRARAVLRAARGEE